MTKEAKLLLIPMLIVVALLIYCWVSLLTTNVIAEWRHYIGLALFIILAYLFFKNIRMCVLGFGLYLLAATFNGLAMMPAISTFWIRIGPIETPPVQMVSLGVFVLYFILNLRNLIEIYMDYEEKKKANIIKRKGS